MRTIKKAPASAKPIEFKKVVDNRCSASKNFVTPSLNDWTLNTINGKTVVIKNQPNSDKSPKLLSLLKSYCRLAVPLLPIDKNGASEIYLRSDNRREIQIIISNVDCRIAKE